MEAASFLQDLSTSETPKLVRFSFFVMGCVLLTKIKILASRSSWINKPWFTWT